jgi:nucleolar protein 4
MGLRWLNGHSIEYQATETKKKATKEDIQDRKKRLIVEFAIENAQVVRRRKEKEARSREAPKVTNSSANSKATSGDVVKSGGVHDKKRKRHAAVEDDHTTKKPRSAAQTAGDAKVQHDTKKVKERKIIASKKHEKRALRKQARAAKG